MFVVIMAGALVALQWSTGAVVAQRGHPQAPMPPESRLAYDGPSATLHLPGEMGPEVAAGNQPVPPALEPQGLAGWSRLAFQSSRNQHDWEIFRARGDGSEQVNLSNNAAMDIHPRLNRGATRIVFASNRVGKYEIYVMNSDGSGLARLTSNSTDDVYPTWSPDGSKIAFQAYRDDQPEVYVMNANGSNQTRLTNSGDYDGEPAWSPDGTKIAFTRRSGGGYRIWVMNADGSGAAQLSTQAYSENAVWSPNGAQIAYDADADGDGWQELMRMDAAGGNQQLIYNPPDSAADAWTRSWSPDGRYIAYTYVTWVNVQGTYYWQFAWLRGWDSQNPSEILYLSSGGEDWNPDWQTMDLWPPRSVMEPMPAQSGSPFLVGWSSTDTGPAGVDTCDIQLRIGAGGAWTNWTMHTYNTPLYYQGTGGQTYYFRVRCRDQAGNVEPWPAGHQSFTTVETIPPDSSVQALPAYSIVGTAMSWDATERGGSNLASVDLQCRDGAAGSWQGCGNYAGSGSQTIPGQAGHTIFMRSRATDSAGNIEPWPPSDGDTHTTLYTGMVSGTALDNAGAPVVGVTVVMTPTAFTISADALDGSYQAYTSQSGGDLEVSLSKAGYGGLPSTSLGAWPSATLHAALPPADNVVRNWGFEGDLSPAWQAGGTVAPVLNNSALHTGRWGAALGWPDSPFALPANVSNLPGWTGLSSAVADAGGRVHVVWSENDTQGHGLGIRYAQRSEDGMWLPPEVVTTNPWSGGAQVAVDQGGIAYIVWSEQPAAMLGEVQFRQRTAGGQWSASENVSRTPGVNSSAPWVRLEGNGTAHVLWHEGANNEVEQVYYAQRPSGGPWSTPIQLSNAGAYGAHPAAMAVGASGDVTVMWSQWIANQGSYIYSAYRNASGTWSAPEQLFDGGSVFLAEGPGHLLHLVWASGTNVYYRNRVPPGSWSAPETVITQAGPPNTALGPDGTVHVAVAIGDELKYVRRSSAGAWSGAELMAARPLTVYGMSLGLDANGTVYAAWRSAYNLNYYHEIDFVRRDVINGWSAVKKLTVSTSQYIDWLPPQLVVDGLDRAHILWTAEANTGSEVFHSVYIGPRPGDAWLRQQLTIPSGAANPGLSFLYQFHRDDPSGTNAFSLGIEDETGTTTAFTTSAVANGWAHPWIDLTPWQGKTITATFRLENPPNSSAAMVYLDEVSAGSTYPNLWVTIDGARTAPQGGRFNYTIGYGNSSRAGAAGSYVTMQLPPDLTFVSADPAPSAITPQLRWDVGELAGGCAPGTIQVTVQVAPPAALFVPLTTTAAIGSAASEIETANNAAQTTTLVGRWMYLPMVARY